MMGVWMLAMASGLPVLLLERRETAAQFWSLLLARRAANTALER
jgi:hypothetical protein